MTHDEHRERHKLLHEHFDELVADWIQYHKAGKLPSNSTILELMDWSYRQTIEPSEDRKPQ